MLGAGTPLINTVVEGGLTLVGAVVVALITSRKVISSQNGAQESLRTDLTDSKDLLYSIRDEVIARNRVMSHAIDRAVFECDPEGSCVFVNREYQHLTGLAASDALGLGWLRCVHHDDQMRVRLAWEWAVQNQERFGPIHFRWVVPGNGIIGVHGEAYPTRNGGGRLRGYVGWLDPDEGPFQKESS